MSQAKVDQHKKEKANRKQVMRREKIERTAAWLIVIAIAAAVCVWIGYSVYGKATASDKEGSSTVEVNTSAVDDYLSSLNAEE